MANLSPMMQQYFRIKESHRDHLLFFRLGDFYEMFYEDAVTASRELGLTLTGRDCGQEERAPMCGVPHHSCEGYIAKLIKKGYKVAICEQMEDPATAKGVVSREVVRVITPGTLMENNLLQEDANNYLCCVFYKPEGSGLSFADISTGEINLVELTGDDDNALIAELARFSPREVVFNSDFLSKKNIAKYMRDKLCCTADLADDESYELERARQVVLAHFAGKSLEDLGLEGRPRCATALGAMLVYLAETQKTGLERLINISVQEPSRYMALDMGARQNLELLRTQRTGEKRGSLLWVLDKAKTPMGKRLMKSWISQPLVSPAEIDKRLNAVEELYRSEILCADIADSLGGVFDIERLMTRIVYGNAGPREYKTLEAAITQLPAVKANLQAVKSQHLAGIERDIDTLEDIRELLAASIRREPPVNLRDGDVIADGHSDELDGLRRLVTGAKDYIARMESEQREATGIKNLKIAYNKVFGYYLEVTRSYLGMVPETYIRKQTLANCERYIIQELKELEEKLLSAHDKAVALEQQLFEQIRQTIIRALGRIQRTATAVARLDVYLSFARVSLENRYVRPVVSAGESIDIRDGRHPVVEQLLGSLPFVPNDTLLDAAGNQIAIITGPNMAGKSTYMRQTALIVLMAQIGCFVPAASATIGVVDGIYTRIGATDDLTTGQSTFMVEMVEVAEILKSASSRSLLILDEIGRGTSTYDGMSIARAVLEYTADPKKLGAKTLFATHYHELTEMESDLERVKNYNIAVKKRGDDITFLYKIIRGGADDSYGIEVAGLAGVPQWIVNRAHEVLSDLEEGRPVRGRGRKRKQPTDDFADIQISLMPQTTEVERMLRDVDLNTYTPIEALTMLYKLKDKLPG